jgi:Bacteriophage head to tail connecting protein
MNAKELRSQAEQIFRKRQPILTLWQEIAENFYPERANFTVSKSLGTEFASGLMTSYPLQCRRELCDAIGMMLRNTAKEWFKMGVSEDETIDNDGKRWLERATAIQKRAMYDRRTQFSNVMKQGDNDYGTFGQDVIQVRLNRDRSGLMYKCHHLRDCAWMENEAAEKTFIVRKYKTYARDLVEEFPETASQKVKAVAQKQPYTEIDCMHIMCEAQMYDGKAGEFPWWSIYYDCTNEVQLEAVAQASREYSVERWQTVSGSQYAYSPATIVALPDARLLQAMTYTLLEAGEKIVNPPLIATEDVVRSDMSVYSGGVTWVDRDYDERLGEALRPMTIDSKGMPLSRDMQDDLRALLSRGFYLNKLALPQTRPEMTAYEVRQYVEQYVRDAMPLFEPMEDERNGQICELTFEELMRAGAFGTPESIPQSLQGKDIKFAFESPLQDAIAQQKGHKFLEMQSMIAQAVQLDQSAAALPDTITALRDALRGIQIPELWINPDIKVQDTIAAQKAAVDSQQQLAAMEQSSVVAKNLGAAGQQMQQMSPA